MTKNAETDMQNDVSKKQKGDLLEKIIEHLCAGIGDARVTRNVRVLGRKSGNQREIDVWIEGRYHMFDVKIAIESKNYAEAIGIERVESFKAKLEDIGADLGVMVCPAGFTKPAKERAEFDRIQLFEIYDSQLGNSNLFVPLRYVEPEIKRFGFTIHGQARGPFSIPSDMSRWRFKVDGRLFDPKQLVLHAWNKGMVPQRAGEHIADFGAIILVDAQEPDVIQYCELEINIEVGENYYLKLVPASFLRGAIDRKEAFNLRIDLWSTEEDMLKNGWKKFATLVEMNKAAEIENQPEGVKQLLMRPNYTIDVDERPAN